MKHFAEQLGKNSVIKSCSTKTTWVVTRKIFFNSDRKSLIPHNHNKPSYNSHFRITLCLCIKKSLVQNLSNENGLDLHENDLFGTKFYIPEWFRTKTRFDAEGNSRMTYSGHWIQTSLFWLTHIFIALPWSKLKNTIRPFLTMRDSRSRTLYAGCTCFWACPYSGLCGG